MSRELLVQELRAPGQELQLPRPGAWLMAGSREQNGTQLLGRELSSWVGS